jgi:hypothetical protein
MEKVQDNTPDLAEVTQEEAKLQKEIKMLIVSFKITGIDMDEVFAGYLIESLDLIREKQGKQTVTDIIDLKTKYDSKFEEFARVRAEKDNEMFKGG